MVIPTYNEGKGLEKRVYVLANELSALFDEFEILIVCDGGTAETTEVLSQIKHPKVRSLVLSINQGKGAAVRRGFQESNGDFLLFIDGGQEIHPREIKIMVGLLSLYEADIVVGSKRHPQSVVKYPIYRRFLSLVFQQIVRLLFHLNVTDTQVGIKIMRREVFEKVLPYLSINRYGFDLELLAYAQRFGFSRILEAPVRLDYFLMQKRFFLGDLLHTTSVGFSLFLDTLLLYYKMKFNK